MKTPKSILTKTKGYLAGYSHSLNPYKGCIYGCSYCYVRRMPVNLFHEGDWGEWVEVKQESKELLKKEMTRELKKGPVTIFMSSSTDPYQPVEHREKITHSLLEVLVEEAYRPDFLLVQTRSPLVVNDLPLFLQFKGNLRVSMTIETDRDEVRKRFANASPPIDARLKALNVLSEAGIATQAAVSPLLPSTCEFPKRLKEVTSRVCLDDFRGDGSEGKRTNALKIGELFESEEERRRWYSLETIGDLQKQFEHVFGAEHVYLGQAGFAPF